MHSGRAEPALQPVSEDGRFTCFDCGRASPDTSIDETSTALTMKHGWRLLRRVVDGTSVLEPRCPSCYARLKARRGPA